MVNKMKNTFIAVLFVCAVLALFVLKSNSADIPDPMKEVAGYAYSDEKVMVTYRDGSEFSSTAEKMGIREFDTFTKNLSRAKGSPPIVRPNRKIVTSAPVKKASPPQPNMVEGIKVEKP